MLLTSPSVIGNETLRKAEQLRLDALKSAAERNKWGQYATPSDLADSIATLALSLARDGEKVSFLDPAVGTGSFFSAMLRTFPPSDIEDACGVELDPLFADTASDLWGNAGLRVIRADFTALPEQNDRFNLILTNPPYVRHHHIPKADKDRMRILIKRSLGIDVNGLAGLYCYFVLLAHRWMAKDGLAIWLIPSEFMDVGYGAALRYYLSQRVSLLRIHRFQPEDLQFADALVSSSVVVFRNTRPKAKDRVTLTFGGSISQPSLTVPVSTEPLRSSARWSQSSRLAIQTKPAKASFGDFFDIKRGIATGNNDFFLVSEEKAKAYSIPREFLRPILPSPRHLETDVVPALSDGTPMIQNRLFLLDCSESEDVIRVKWPVFFSYLEKGKRDGVDQGYLTQKRNPWYGQERRRPAPFLCTYMGRPSKGNKTFRLIWNQSDAIAANVYMMLYPKATFARMLDSDRGLPAKVYRVLSQIGEDSFLSCARSYGGGLFKLEPGEIASIYADPLLDVFGEFIGVNSEMDF